MTRARPAFARQLGAVWTGGSDAAPPNRLDAALIFAPVGALVPAALRALENGGTVVCAGIHMSDIPSFPYSDLWEERVVRSVANLTRRDGEEFLALAPGVPVETRTTVVPAARRRTTRSTISVMVASRGQPSSCRRNPRRPADGSRGPCRGEGREVGKLARARVPGL